jgi:hypothetical protein
MKFPARLTRLASVLGLAVTAGAALLAGATAASAAPNQPAETVQNSTVQDHADRAQIAAGPSDTRYAFMKKSAQKGDCQDFEICIWTGANFTGDGVFFGGNYAPCQGWRFEGTRWQDNTWSIWNQASGPISIWNRYADGTYRYTKYGLLPRGYQHSTTKFSYIMDAWVYDPNNNCTSLDLVLLNDDGLG